MIERFWGQLPLDVEVILHDVLRFGFGSTYCHLSGALKPAIEELVASPASRRGKCPHPAGAPVVMLFGRQVKGCPTIQACWAYPRSVSAELGAVCKELSANMKERGRTSKYSEPPANGGLSIFEWVPGKTDPRLKVFGGWIRLEC